MRSILRILLAAIFLASGFVKAVDVIGFSFKLEEYFSPAVFNLPFFERQALPLAITVVITELVFGWMLLIKSRLKLTIIVLIAMCIFFAFLTFYSAYFNVVTDCGCFGDALTFTPWQSFWKDIALLSGLMTLAYSHRTDLKNPGRENQKKWFATLPALFLMIFIIYWGIAHEPLIDFRDYKIGTNLNKEKKKIAQNPSDYKTFYTVNNTKTGEMKELDQDEYVSDKKYWAADSPWTIDESKTVSRMTRQGYDSEISKFKPESQEGKDLTDEILNAPKAILICVYDPKNVNHSLLSELENAVKKNNDASIYGISTDPSVFKQIAKGTMDGTAIKTIARSNPFVLTLQRGTIVGKQGANDYIKQKKNKQ